ncbi:Auxin response factor [Rhynchospora pubera]|uniref:Auxin response factor n=1 Tax=Rhynchospora pubera TaxID=906938 RepID=A0AAV8GS54_9POAL|nr:Auxin response factor [Rhynchospora pubera]
MITFMESPKDPPARDLSDHCLDPQLWHACAGSMVQMPSLNSKVYYFPQGHLEHFSVTAPHEVVPMSPPCRNIPPLILCHVSSIKYLADPNTDEVYAKIGLVPVGANESDMETGQNSPQPEPEKPASFAKTLTQSDANNGGGFSVPRYCAETIFPRLDYTADPPVQTVLAKDVHGTVWKFRHIYRGTPRRHLLTTGWSTFVNHKKLVAGDSIVFLRADNGDLCVGIRRAKRGIGAGFGTGESTGWGYGGFSMFLREDDGIHSKHNLLPNKNSKSRIHVESVLEAARLAAEGRPFEVVYYPRASTPEFFVRAGLVRSSMCTRWGPGMRFKMAFETEDSSRISWFMGTVSGVQVADPINWPNSPWRLLQVTWDEPDLLQNVKRVSPWLVELVSNIPSIHLAPFSPPRKKLCIPAPPDLPHPLHSHFNLTHPFLPGTPLGFVPGPTQPPLLGIQGARHALFGFTPPDRHLSQLSQLGPLGPSVRPCIGNITKQENVSCFLTIGTPDKLDTEKSVKKPHIMLFGKPILTEKQMSLGGSGDTAADVGHTKHEVLNEGPGLGLGFETGHCKVFMESEDVGRTLDLTGFESYEELYGRLANMFGVEKEELMRQVRYRDAAGALKQTGDEPFSEFMKTARRLTILADSGSDNFGR